MRLAKHLRGQSRARRAQSVLYAVLLMPTLFLVFGLAIDMAGLQFETLRLRYALDLATVTAATSVDGNFYSQTGRLRLDPAAATVTAREFLLRNLEHLPDVANPPAVVSSADIAIVNQVPAVDPYSGALLDRPTVTARIRVSHRFSLLGWIGISNASITVSANSQIRR